MLIVNTGVNNSDDYALTGIASRHIPYSRGPGLGYGVGDIRQFNRKVEEDFPDLPGQGAIDPW